MSKRVYEIGFEAKLNGRWHQNWSRRIVTVQAGAAAAIEKAEKKEGQFEDDDGKTYLVRAEYAKLIVSDVD